MLIKKQMGVLHKLNVYRLKTLDLAFESAIDVGKWEDALRFGIDLIPGFRCTFSLDEKHKRFSNNFDFAENTAVISAPFLACCT